MNRSLVIFSFVLSCLASAGFASAQSRFHVWAAGQLCRTDDFSWHTHIMTDAVRRHEVEYRYGTLACSIPLDNIDSTANDDIHVFYDDRADTQGTDLACRAFFRDRISNAFYITAQRYSCPTVGGCAFQPLSYQGAGYLTFTDVQRFAWGTFGLYCDSATPTSAAKSVSLLTIQYEAD